MAGAIFDTAIDLKDTLCFGGGGGVGVFPPDVSHLTTEEGSIESGGGCNHCIMHGRNP